MYCNFAKSQAIPLVFRASSGPKSLKPFNGVYSKRSDGAKLRNHPQVVCLNVPESFSRVKASNFSSGFFQNGSEKNIGSVMKLRNLSSGLHPQSTVKTVCSVRRNYSNGYPRKGGERDGGGFRAKKALPWIKNKGAKGSEKVPTEKASRSSWEESANDFLRRSGVSVTSENRQSRDGTVDMVESRNGNVPRDESRVIEEVEDEVVDDPRWDRIRSRYMRVDDAGPRFERPEVHRWNKQENWGRQTWKEATVSTLPRMIGEGVYGVGPVLAALSSGRREFYALYVQEGLDLSSNNRKKKDKKGFEKALRIAEKFGLTPKEASKHDLNMIVDNRPHQGLVLDASPLEMVSVRELDPVSPEGDAGLLWVALDEVTDPQNLGAIIRSAYFFGAAGVVLCAKNSAPLTGVVSKASAGSLELMELRSCKNMMQFLSSSADNGWRVLGGSISSRALPLNEVPAGAPTILVLGSEGTGLRPLVERSCTDLVRIPGNIPVDISAGGAEGEKAEGVDRFSGEEFQSFLAVESLNVSVAAGVLLHHLIGTYSPCKSGDNQACLDS